MEETSEITCVFNAARSSDWTAGRRLCGTDGEAGAGPGTNCNAWQSVRVSGESRSKKRSLTYSELLETPSWLFY